MKRTVSSDRPLGAFSDSISVTNPYLYWSTSIRRTWSTVSCTAGILPSAHGFKDRGLDQSAPSGANHLSRTARPQWSGTFVLGMVRASPLLAKSRDHALGGYFPS